TSSVGIAVTPSSLSFVTAAGASPSAQTLQVSTATAGSLGATVTATVATTSGGQWLSVTPTATGTSPVTLTATVASASLAPGIYQGTITIAANGVAGTQAVPVTL